jgi:DnaK suppressor protein
MLALDERQRLLAKKHDLEQLMQTKIENISIPMQEWTDELTSYDQHPGDSASDLYEREKEMRMLELLEFELEKVNDALNRTESFPGSSYEVFQD